jgi:hypothetical protein
MLDEMSAALACQTIFSSKKTKLNVTSEIFIRDVTMRFAQTNFHVWAPAKSLTRCSIALLSKIRFRGAVYDSVFL